ncbi:hypothetical protein HDV06_007171 [Boothiomyces sp. JEL0866]|nr:hypothetical protein HDV06_007171 [Boothiomyces sp. JEL0866]
MGVDFDGSYHYDISFSSPDGIVAGIIMVLYLVGTLVVLGVVINDVRKEPTKATSRNMLFIQILFLLWQILQLFINSSLCNPMIVWATNVVGSIVILLINIAQWRIFGPGLIAFMGVLFETWHAYFLLLKLNKFQNMNSFLGKSISPEARKASLNLRMFVIFDIIMIWIGLVIYMYAFTCLKGAQLNSISAIGATLGESHCLTIIFVFKLVKNINQHLKHSKQHDTNGKSGVPTTSKTADDRPASSVN